MSFISEYDPLQPVSPLQAASRFDSFFDVYGLSLKQAADISQRTVTLVARSPASACAQALALNLGRFQPSSIEVSIIFTQIAPANALNTVVQSVKASCRAAPETIIRWAKNRALLDAHERLTLGRTLCWTGDSMRRSDDSRSAIDRVDDGTPDILAEADASFAALWRASIPLPKTLFSRIGAQAEAEKFALSEPLPTGLAVDANVVRLDAYLRSKRH